MSASPRLQISVPFRLSSLPLRGRPHRQSLKTLARLIWLLVCWAIGIESGSVCGQETKPDVRFSVANATSGGSNVYSPEKWGLLHINVTNRRHEPRELLVATFFDAEPTLQFGRRLWLPARSTLHTTQPVLIPKLDRSSERSLGFHTLVFDASESEEVLIKADSGQLLNDGAILVSQRKQITGMIEDRHEVADQESAAPYELVLACRLGQLLDRRVAGLAYEGLPTDEFSLQALDHLVVAGDRLLSDPAGLAAVRRWLHGGGRLWVMLDRTDPRILEMLLGDEVNCRMVDRVGLTSVRIDPVLAGPNQQTAPTLDHEMPVDLVRVAVSDVEVTHTVNGWPAAFQKSYGDGRLLVTTLGPRGWMIRRTEAAPNVAPPPAELSSMFIPLHPMADLSSKFMMIRTPELIPPSILSPEVTEHIGYSIPGRGVVLGLLSGFVVTLVVAGGWLWRRSQLEHFGWIGPLLGVVCGAALIVIGHFNRHEIPATVAVMQVVQMLPGTDDVRLRGLVATYHPEGSPTPINAAQGGRLIPDMTGLEGTSRRMVWTDLETWHWENVPQAAGQVVVPFAQSTTLPQRIEVRASLGPKGLSGQLSGDLSGVSDAVVVARAGRIGVQLKPGGEFVASADNVFSRDQYLDAQLLSDEQDRRRRVLLKLLNHSGRPDYPDRPQFLFWTDEWPTGLDVGAGLRSRGATLCAIPLKLDRPRDGQEFLIPAPLLPFRTVHRPDGKPSSQLWNHQSREWRESATYSAAWLRFQVPTEILPVTVKRARVVVEVAGPIGRFELLGLHQSKVISLGTQRDPVGSMSFEISDLDVLRIAADGGLRLGMNVGDRSRPELTQADEVGGKSNYWRIESLALTLWGKTGDF